MTSDKEKVLKYIRKNCGATIPEVAERLELEVSRTGVIFKELEKEHKISITGEDWIEDMKQKTRQGVFQEIKSWLVGYLSTQFATKHKATKVFIDDVLEDYEKHFIKTKKEGRETGVANSGKQVAPVGGLKPPSVVKKTNS